MAIDFDKVCRSCLTEANRMHFIFQAEEDETFSISQLLNSITDIQASQDDGLPKQMCSVCHFELQQAIAFKRKAEQSHYELQQLEVKHESQPELVIKMELDPYNSTIKFVNENSSETPPPPDAEFESDGDYQAEYLSYNFEEELEDLKIRFQPVTTASVQVKKRGRPKITSPIKPKASKTIKIDVKPVDNIDITGQKLFQCSSCQSCYDDQTGIRKHNLKCDLRANDSNARVNCSNCYASFKQVTTLNRHITTFVCLQKKAKVKQHRRNFNCAHCPMGYRQRDRFLTHLIVHGFEPLLPCQHCDQELPSSAALREHIRSQHSVRSHLCQICGKSFFVKNTLRLHMLRHDPHKAFKCTLCPFGCITKNEMENHMTKHTGEHPFECKVCGHRSTTRSARARHMRIHTGEKKHACEFCPMRFAVPYTLKNHRRTHTGEKPYACDQCDRTFTQRYDCISHQKSHIVGYKFPCKHCPQTFDRHSSLKVHTKTHSTKTIKQEHITAIGSILTLGPN